MIFKLAYNEFNVRVVLKNATSSILPCTFTYMFLKLEKTQTLIFIITELVYKNGKQ